MLIPYEIIYQNIFECWQWCKREKFKELSKFALHSIRLARPNWPTGAFIRSENLHIYHLQKCLRNLEEIRQFFSLWILRGHDWTSWVVFGHLKPVLAFQRCMKKGSQDSICPNLKRQIRKNTEQILGKLVWQALSEQVLKLQRDIKLRLYNSFFAQPEFHFRINQVGTF